LGRPFYHFYTGNYFIGEKKKTISMAFITDKQTLDDLGIFGRPGNESVYSLYNRTCTAGGAALLEEMFNYPLSNAEAINDRLMAIQRFAIKRMSFPFKPGLFGMAEHYLQQTDERTKLTHEHNSIGNKFLHFIQSDAEYKLLHKGVLAVREIIITTWQCLHSLSPDDASSFTNEKNSIIELLQEEPFLDLVNQKKNHVLSHAEVAQFDTVFRFKKRAEIKRILHFIYRLDVYIAVAGVAVEKRFCFPKALQEKSVGLKLEKAWHPLVKNAVANTISITAEKNIVFLTGANMAGKSTFMKTLGIAVFLAHMGFPAAAGKIEFTVMDGLYTTINLADNLGAGASHFYAEVLRIKKIAKELAISKDLLVIVDELFRGTNVKDAYEATIAVITSFARRRSSLFVISTHIIEAGEVIKDTCANSQFLYMPTTMNGNVPVYSYQLQQGITNDRHGMVIIKNEGILDILQPRSQKIMHELRNG
jgi:DNA mismatch repair protein MutS